MRWFELGMSRNSRGLVKDPVSSGATYIILGRSYLPRYLFNYWLSIIATARADKLTIGSSTIYKIGRLLPGCGFRCYCISVPNLMLVSRYEVHLYTSHTYVLPRTIVVLPSMIEICIVLVLCIIIASVGEELCYVVSQRLQQRYRGQRPLTILTL